VRIQPSFDAVGSSSCRCSGVNSMGNVTMSSPRSNSYQQTPRACTAASGGWLRLVAEWTTGCAGTWYWLGWRGRTTPPRFLSARPLGPRRRARPSGSCGTRRAGTLRLSLEDRHWWSSRHRGDRFACACSRQPGSGASGRASPPAADAERVGLQPVSGAAPRRPSRRSGRCAGGCRAWPACSRPPK